MSLRDYFAAQALSALVVPNTLDGSHKEIAAKAYQIADAMLTERKSTK